MYMHKSFFFTKFELERLLLLSAETLNFKGGGKMNSFTTATLKFE
jgi:hypothetical protein